MLFYRFVTFRIVHMDDKPTRTTNNGEHRISCCPYHGKLLVEKVVFTLYDTQTGKKKDIKEKKCPVFWCGYNDSGWP